MPENHRHHEADPEIVEAGQLPGAREIMMAQFRDCPLLGWVDVRINFGIVHIQRTTDLVLSDCKRPHEAQISLDRIIFRNSSVSQPPKNSTKIKVKQPAATGSSKNL